MKQKYSDIDKEAALEELYDTTKPQSTIAKEFGVSVSTIRQWRKDNENKKNPSIRKYYKIIALIGVVFLILGYTLHFKNNIFPCLFMLFASLFQIPEGYYIFIVNSRNERLSGYYIVQFASLIAVAILGIIGIIKILSRP